MSLKEYRRKRNFAKTTEPAGAIVSRGKRHRFVIQKHAATRLHYDLRLEIDGTLKSWAVPKGIPLAKGEKRLAVEVEDHPVSYIDFEGVIPKGQYGGGTVMVWDKGTFKTESKDPATDLRAGKLHFNLAGKKLHGEWYLVRLRDSKQWLLIKGGSDMSSISKKMDDTSARSGKSMAELGSSRTIWENNGAAVQRPQRKSETKRTSPRTKPRTVAPTRFVPPLLARTMASIPRGEWLYELKFDGYRASILKSGGDIKMLSRNEKDLGSRFPRILEDAQQIDAGQVIIDGEI